jgi:hypothetical protein
MVEEFFTRVTLYLVDSREAGNYLPEHYQRYNGSWSTGRQPEDEPPSIPRLEAGQGGW